jgi:hypothetical protein
MQILKLKNLSFLLIIFASVLVVISCGDDDDPPTGGECETENLTYDNWAKDYIDGSCATSGCHDADFAANMVPFGMFDYLKERRAQIWAYYYVHT